MPDTKISALTALAAANVATDDEMPIVDTSVTTTKKVTMAALSARPETMTNKTLTSPAITTPTGIVKGDVGLGNVDNTSDVTKDAAATTLTNKTLDKAVILGVPAAEGAFGRDTTQKALTTFNNGMLGTIGKVLVAGVGTQALINSTVADQDFTTLFQLPANVLFTNKVFRVTVWLEYIGGTSAVTVVHYLKLGSTKTWTLAIGINLTDNVTRSIAAEFLIIGRAATGAAANVTTMQPAWMTGFGPANSVDQPVALATNGVLDIIFGLTFSGTGSTESVELQGWMVEELN